MNLMAPHNSLTLLLHIIIIVISMCFHGITGVEYKVSHEVPDTPGGKRWAEGVGIEGAKELMREANEYIWSNVFQQNSPENRKPVDTVLLYVVINETYKVWADDNIINISASYIPTKEYVKSDFKQILYYAMTVVLQWTGEGKCPYILRDGIGWYTNVKANLLPWSFPEPGDGDKWDQEDYVIARFLEYCDQVTPGFVAKFNEKLKKTYDESFFKELTGKSVDELWKDYKAKYPEQ